MYTVNADSLTGDTREQVKRIAQNTAELVETDFIQTVFPHPTLSEMMHESVLAAFGRVIHI